MAVASFLLIIISLSCVSSLNDNTTDYCNQLNCPPWMQAKGSECVCRNDLPKEFSCKDGGGAFLNFFSCMSMDDNDTVSVGECAYPKVSADLGVELPSNLSIHELNAVFCDPLNREGILCHRCKEGFGVAPLSLEYACVECPDNTAGWWVLFLVLQFGPVTIFYLINLVWQVSFAKAPFRSYVFFSQILFRLFSSKRFRIGTYNLSVFAKVCFYALEFLNGIWSLNFVSVLPPFCISTSFTNIHFVYLQYLVAVYPLFLIALTLVLHKLHERNFKPVVILWKPFHRCFISTRQMWDYKSSIVNVIVNFCLFSLSKIIFIVFTGFNFSEKYNLCVPGQVEPSVLVDPSIPYPDPVLLILSLVFSIATITVITLVSCYPLKCMKLCFKRCCRSQVFLYFQAFFEDFTSSYKDGTTKGSCCNLKYLVVVYPVLLIVLRAIVFVTSKTVRSVLPAMYSLLLFFFAVFIALVRPYKKATDYVTESLLIVLMAVVFELGCLDDLQLSKWRAYVYILLVSIPHGCFVMFIVYSVCKRYKRYCACGCKEKKEVVEDNELPDRFVNAENYVQRNVPKPTIGRVIL
ncbi:uncharacterized protein LOC135349160 [Halichondria panicea]|uniref:uncharacterized protein LOC135349160 n=1 Tax=Halichondria panicea TaxID=6063 RepID=UPI00312BA057